MSHLFGQLRSAASSITKVSVFGVAVFCSISEADGAPGAGGSDSDGFSDVLAALDAIDSSSFYAVRDEEGRSQLLAGGNLLSPGCSMVAGSADISPEAAIRRAACFVEHNKAALDVGDSAFDAETDVVWSTTTTPEEGEVVVAGQQFWEGAAVKQGLVKLHFIGADLVLVSGSLRKPSGFPTRQFVQRSAASGDRYFDADLNNFVVEEVSGERESTWIDVVDEFTGDIVESKPGYFESGAAPYAQSVWAYPYPAADGLFRPANPASTSLISIPGSRTCSTPACVTCTFYTSAQDAVPAVPDRPKYVSYIAPIGVETELIATAACGATPFTGGSYNYPDYKFHASNAARLVHHLADMRQHYSSYFSPSSNPSGMMLTAQVGATGGGGGIYTPFDKRVVVEVNEAGGQISGTSAFVIGHEYGHFVHDTFGFPSSNIVALREGWADTFPLRYAVYRQVSVGDWSSANYDMNLAALRAYKHTHQLARGEWVVKADPARPNGYYYPFPSAAGCANSYDCGSVMGITYWELAYNRCELGYNTCAQDQQIMSNAPYPAWALANSAYAYAIQTLGANMDPAAFLNIVGERYRQFQVNYGYITATEYNRVLDVLAHHCTGSGSRCATTHRFPGSPLPSYYTLKKLLKQGEAYHSIGGPTAPSVISWSGASYGQYLSVPQNGWVRYDFAIPAGEGGNYKIRMVVWDSAVAANANFNWTGGPGYTNYALSYDIGPAGDWQWRIGPTANFASGATVSVWVQRPASPSGGLLIDAVALEKVP